MNSADWCTLLTATHTYERPLFVVKHKEEFTLRSIQKWYHFRQRFDHNCPSWLFFTFISVKEKILLLFLDRYVFIYNEFKWSSSSNSTSFVIRRLQRSWANKFLSSSSVGINYAYIDTRSSIVRKRKSWTSWVNKSLSFPFLHSQLFVSLRKHSFIQPNDSQPAEPCLLQLQNARQLLHSMSRTNTLLNNDQPISDAQQPRTGFVRCKSNSTR